MKNISVNILEQVYPLYDVTSRYWKTRTFYGMLENKRYFLSPFQGLANFTQEDL